MKTIVINLFGTHGAGKSTTAAYLFYNLKMVIVNCEKELYNKYEFVSRCIWR